MVRRAAEIGGAPRRPPIAGSFALAYPVRLRYFPIREARHVRLNWAW